MKDTQTQADLIWNEIKDVKLELFALPDQFIHKNVTPVKIDPSKLYLKYNISALLPSIEKALEDKFNVSLLDKYIVIERKV